MESPKHNYFLQYTDKPIQIGLGQAIARLLLIVPWTISVFPATTLCLVYTASFRAMQLIGYWPVVGRDDPFNIGDNDKIYQFIIWCIWWNDYYFIFALITAIFIHFSLPSYKLRTIFKMQVMLFIFSLWLLFCDPTSRYEWWLD